MCVCMCGVCGRPCASTCCAPQKRESWAKSLFPLSCQDLFLYYRFFPFPSNSLFFPSSFILPFPIPTQGLVTSLMKETGKYTVSPDSKFFHCPASFCSFNPLPSQTSATHFSPIVWDYFPVCGKENSSASNSMPFLDPVNWQSKKLRPITIKASGSPPLLDHFSPYSLPSSLQQQTNHMWIPSQSTLLPPSLFLLWTFCFSLWPPWLRWMWLFSPVNKSMRHDPPTVTPSQSCGLEGLCCPLSLCQLGPNTLCLGALFNKHWFISGLQWWAMGERILLLPKLANFLKYLRNWEMSVVTMSLLLWSVWAALIGTNDIKDQPPKGQQALHKTKCAMWPQLPCPRSRATECGLLLAMAVCRLG